MEDGGDISLHSLCMEEEASIEGGAWFGEAPRTPLMHEGSPSRMGSPTRRHWRRSSVASLVGSVTSPSGKGSPSRQHWRRASATSFRASVGSVVSV